MRVALLRGINLGPNRRIPMAGLRERLQEAGYGDVRTYVQSGNIVLSSDAAPGELEAELAARLEEWFGFAVPVVVRTISELEAIVAGDPLAGVVDNPKWYQVTFLSGEADPQAMQTIAELARDGERVVSRGREIYAWHPGGQARSKLALALAGRKLGVTATARNWTTVTALWEMGRR